MAGRRSLCGNAFLGVVFVLLLLPGWLWAAVEVEPNNNQADATALSLGVDYQGVISGDSDYYRFTLATNANVTVSLKPVLVGSGGSWRVRVYRASDNLELNNFIVYNSGTEGGGRVQGLPAGAYYVVVSNWSSVSEVPYLLRVSAEAGETFEQEPNGSASTAQTIALGTDYRGLITGGVSDSDHYRFTLATNANVTVSLKPVLVGSVGSWNVRVYRASDNLKLNDFMVYNSGTEGGARVQGLPAGAYYVVVSNWSSVSEVPYLLRVSAEAGETFEQEPNGSASTAQTIALGTDYRGLITGGVSDVDYYKFTLTSAQIISITIAPVDEGNDSGRWRVFVLRETDGAEVADFLVSTVGTVGVVRELDLSRDAYRIVISNYSSAAEKPYRLRVAPTVKHVLSVSPSANGRVTSSPAGIDCGTDCSESYSAGSSIKLTAAANDGYLFTGWSGACSNTSAECTLTMDAAKTVSAAFSQPASTTPLPIGGSVDAVELEWTTGAAAWVGQVDSNAVGGDAVRSAAIGDNQTSSLRTTVSGPGTVRFKWRVSSEANWDFLQFLVDGIEQEKISGETAWSQKSFVVTGSGVHTLEWKYTKDESQSDGQDAGWLDDVEWIPAAPTSSLPIGGSVDADELTWSSAPPAWFGQVDPRAVGGDAARSAVIGDSQTSTVQTTVTGPGTVRFKWRVSSEQNYDFLKFFVDNVPQDQISGTVGWQQASFPVSGSGTHTLSWQYIKDHSVPEGEDAGWLDDVEWIPAGVAVPQVSSISPQTVVVGKVATFTVEGTNLPAGMVFSLDGCVQASEVGTGTATKRMFQCSPAQLGTMRGTLVPLNHGFDVTIRAAVGSAPARFAFNLIPDTVAGSPTLVQIRAVDELGNLLTEFNERVDLEGVGLQGMVFRPRQAQFKNGAANVLLTFKVQSSDAKLRVIWNYLGCSRIVIAECDPSELRKLEVRCDSNVFQVQATNSPFPIRGATNVPQVSVQLVSITDSSIKFPAVPVLSNGSGEFSIGPVSAGRYRIIAQKSGYVLDCGPDGSKCIVNGSSKSISVHMNPSIARRPVLILPGMMGSTLKDNRLADKGIDTPRRVGDHIAGYAAKLPKERCYVGDERCPMRHELQFYDPAQSFLGQEGSTMGSHLLKQALADAGFDPIEVPWDWRLTFDEAAKIFLKPAIDDVKISHRVSKVDVVAHSMGGLVTRSYIQSADYANDIDRFVMLGTPNFGSTNAYYLMEGGDPITIDRAVSTLASGTVAQVAAYTAMTNELWRTHNNGADMVTGLSSDGDMQQASDYRKGVTTRDVWEFLNKYVPGGRGLLPTSYDFLCFEALLQHGADCISPAINPELAALNLGGANLGRLIPLTASPGVSGVRTVILLSTTENTLSKVWATAPQISTGIQPYANGVPTGDLVREDGDGTVLARSGQGPFGPDFVIGGAWGSHPEIVGKARATVVQLLAAGRVMTQAAAAEVAQAEVGSAFNFSAGALISSDAEFELLLTAPGGARTGTVAGVAEVLTELPASDSINTAYLNTLRFGSLADGNYTLRVSADSMWVNEAAQVTVSFYQGGTSPARRAARLLVKDGGYPLVLRVSGSGTSAYDLTLMGAVAAPTGLVARPELAGAHLRWSAPAGVPSGTRYRVYARAPGMTVFEMLAETTSTSAQTSIPWASDYQDSTEFVVVTVNPSGAESLIGDGNSVRNLSYARAAFSAAGEAADGTLPAMALPATVTLTDASVGTNAIVQWAWDLDGDGVVDSTERNPVLSLQRGAGDYSIGLSVTAADGTTDSLRRPLRVRGTDVIGHYYRNILNREPDSGGVSYWQNEIERLRSLGADPSEAYRVMANYFFVSPEFTARTMSDGQFVSNLYGTFFRREPDGAGYAYWTGQIGQGMPWDMVMYAFMFSPEFSAYMAANAGAVSARAEVYAVFDFYRGAFGRLPDSEGLKYWVNRFRSAQCLPETERAGGVYRTAIDIAGGFFGSGEYWATPPSAGLYVSDLYNAFMRRSGDLDGYSWWVLQLELGLVSHDAMRRAFIDSPEFGQRVNAIVAAGCTGPMQ